MSDLPKKTGRGGIRKGAGRKPRHHYLTNHEKGLAALDDALPAATKVLIKGLKDPDKNYRKSCAVKIIDKLIADKKQTDLENQTVNYGLNINMINGLSDTDLIELKKLQEKVKLDAKESRTIDVSSSSQIRDGSTEKESGSN